MPPTPRLQAHRLPTRERSTALASTGHVIPVWKSYGVQMEGWGRVSWVSELRFVRLVRKRDFRKPTLARRQLILGCALDAPMVMGSQQLTSTAGGYRPFWHIVITLMGDSRTVLRPHGRRIYWRLMYGVSPKRAAESSSKLVLGKIRKE